MHSVVVSGFLSASSMLTVVDAQCVDMQYAFPLLETQSCE